MQGSSDEDTDGDDGRGGLDNLPANGEDLDSQDEDDVGIQGHHDDLHDDNEGEDDDEDDEDEDEIGGFERVFERDFSRGSLDAELAPSLRRRRQQQQQGQAQNQGLGQGLDGGLDSNPDMDREILNRNRLEDDDEDQSVEIIGESETPTPPGTTYSLDGDESSDGEDYFRPEGTTASASGPSAPGLGAPRVRPRKSAFDVDDGDDYSPRQQALESQLGAWGHSFVMFSSIGFGLYAASRLFQVDFVRFLGMVFLGGLGMLAARPNYNPRMSTMIEHNLNEAELETIRTFVQRRVDLHDAPGAARDEYLGRLKRSSMSAGMSGLGGAGASGRGGGNLYNSGGPAAAGYPSNYIRMSSGGLGPVPENEEDLYF